MKTIPGKKPGHLFTVDILLEGHSNGIALEKLIQLLNSEKIVDYRITKGIFMGKIIEATEKAASAAKLTESSKPVVSVQASKPEEKPADNSRDSLLVQIDLFKKNNTLLRLSVVKGLGVIISMPCRILNYDIEDDNLSVYHVDEKKVYQFNLNEIDDITPN